MFRVWLDLPYRSDQVGQKLGCTATQDGYRLEISDLGSRGTVLCMKQKQRC